MAGRGFGPPGGSSRVFGEPDERAANVGDDYNSCEEEALERVEFLLNRCEAFLTHKSNFLGNIRRVTDEWKASIPHLSDIALPSPEVLSLKIQYFDLLHRRDPEVARRALLGSAAADLRERLAEVGEWARRVNGLWSEVQELERRIEDAESDHPPANPLVNQEGEESW
jgi:hypothetical protein